MADPVAGTPWRLVLSVPEEALYSPLTTSGRFLPWVFLTAFALVATVLVGLLVRGREARWTLAADANWLLASNSAEAEVPRKPRRSIFIMGEFNTRVS